MFQNFILVSKFDLPKLVLNLERVVLKCDTNMKRRKNGEIKKSKVEKIVLLSSGNNLRTPENKHSCACQRSSVKRKFCFWLPMNIFSASV